MKSLLALACLLLASAAAAAPPTLDWMPLRQAVTVYIPNPEGRALTVAVRRVDLNLFCQGPQTMLVKLYGPEGEVLQHAEVPDDGVTCGSYQQARAGWDHELWAQGGLRAIGAEPLYDDERFFDPARLASLPAQEVRIDVPAGQPGVHQLLLAGCDDHVVQVALTPDRGVGVLGHPDFAVIRPDGRPRWLYVPPLPDYVQPADVLDLWLVEHGYPRQATVTVSHEGKPLTFTNALTPAETTRLTAGQGLGQFKLKDPLPPAGALLKLDIVGQRRFLLRVHGVPGILCPDEATARAIAGGITRLPNGPAVSLPFQRKLWDSLTHLKAEDFRVSVEPGKWYQPDRQELARLKALAWERSHDPKAVDRTLAAVNKLLDQTQPFDLHRFMQGLSIKSAAANDLMLFYLLPLEGNQLAGNAAVRNLVLLALAQQWLRIRAGDVVYEPTELNLAYAEGFHWNWWETLLYLQPALSPATREAFQQGVARVADRLAYANGLELVLSNGRTTIPLNLFHASLICQEPRFAELSRLYLQRMMNAQDGPHSGWSPSGYFREHFGADGGYCTYPLYQLGRLYALSKDPAVLDAMDRLCRWIAHTTFPAGDKLIGPTSWNARIDMSAGEHVWGDGQKFIAAQSPWAARLYRRHPNTAKLLDLPDPKLTAPAPQLPTLLMTPYTRNVRPEADWPCESREPAFVDIGEGGEFFAVNRGSYYALTYAGKRPPFWMDHFLGGVMGMTGGGLTGLYIRGVGPVLLGRQSKQYGQPLEQWRQMAAPAVVGVMSDGRVFHTGVSRCTPVAQPDQWTLTVSGEAVTAPVNFTRQYRFDAEVIRAQANLTAADLHRDVFQYQVHFNKPTLAIREAWEVVPLWSALPGAQLTGQDAAGAAVELSATEGRLVKTISLITASGGVRLELEQATEVKLAEGKLSAVYLLMGRDLPTDGGTASIRYVLKPVIGAK